MKFQRFSQRPLPTQAGIQNSEARNRRIPRSTLGSNVGMLIPLILNINLKSDILKSDILKSVILKSDIKNGA
jgi:hypothetical protein